MTSHRIAALLTAALLTVGVPASADTGGTRLADVRLLAHFDRAAGRPPRASRRSPAAVRSSA